MAHLSQPIPTSPGVHNPNYQYVNWINGEYTVSFIRSLFDQKNSKGHGLLASYIEFRGLQITTEFSSFYGRMFMIKICDFVDPIVGRIQYSKISLKRPLKKRQNKALIEKNGSWMKVESIVLHYFRPALSSNRSWKPIFGCSSWVSAPDRFYGSVLRVNDLFCMIAQDMNFQCLSVVFAIQLNYCLYSTWPWHYYRAHFY